MLITKFNSDNGNAMFRIVFTGKEDIRALKDLLIYSQSKERIQNVEIGRLIQRLEVTLAGIRYDNTKKIYYADIQEPIELLQGALALLFLWTMKCDETEKLKAIIDNSEKIISNQALMIENIESTLSTCKDVMTLDQQQIDAQKQIIAENEDILNEIRDIVRVYRNYLFCEEGSINQPSC